VRDWRTELLEALLMALFGVALIVGAFAAIGRAVLKAIRP
jgi:uncharacterized membrane protein